MAKDVALQEYSRSLPEDLQEQVIRDNFSTLKRLLMKQGVVVMLNAVDKVERSTASASYVAQESLRQAFVSSGGYVEVEFRATGTNDAANRTLGVALALDGVVVDEISLGGTAEVTAPVKVGYEGFVGAGNHRLDIYLKATGGAVKIGEGGLPNTFLAKEYIL